MNSVLKLFLLACGLLFLLGVLRLLLKKKISEWNSISWLSGAVLILILAANPKLIDRAAGLFGISYPPSLLFLFSTLVLLLLVLYQSTQISSLQTKLRQIAQQVAINRQSEQERVQHLLQEVAASREPEMKGGEDAHGISD